MMMTMMSNMKSTMNSMKKKKSYMLMDSYQEMRMVNFVAKNIENKLGLNLQWLINT